MNIISKADVIKEKRKTKYEIISFLTTCILIVSTFVLFAIKIDVKLIIYTQIIFSILLPVTVIPISIHIQAKEEQ